MNIIDVILIIFLISGAIAGFKRGLVTSVVSLVGTILILILAYYLKNPISAFMYTNMPFFSFAGVLKGVTVLNILIYEAIAFLITFAILRMLLSLILKVTGILDSIIKWTFLLTIPAKLLGAIVGLIEAFVFLYLVLFIGNQINILNSLTKESEVATKILNKTPILSNIMGDAFTAVDEIYSLKTKYEAANNSNEYNIEAMDILLKYEIITPASARNLISKGKISTPGIIDIVTKYEVNK